jgi:hypothetical protein
MAPLTFGIELECHVATLTYGEEDPEPQDPRQVYDLTMQIIDSRVQELRYVQRQVAKKLQKETGVILIPGNKQPTPRLWEVTEDVTLIEHSGPGKYVYFPLESISPPLTSSLASFTEVHKMCTTISQAFRATCNQTCGFHVHVGNGIGESETDFSFNAMRNLLAII